MKGLRGLSGLTAAIMAAVPAFLLLPQAGMAQIDEIVVSTRKKEESLQDVPIAVTAIGAEQIERLGISNLDDVVKLAPSVQFDNSFGPSDTRITIRGLSNTRGRSNVAFLVDGIDVTTENLITAGSGLLANRRLLNDVERIELVKGPQSALYGRAAFAGAISYITKEPEEEFGGKLGLDFAQDGQEQVSFALGGPVKGAEDVLGVRFSGVWWDEDGRYINSTTGNDFGGSSGYGGAFTTVFTPNDTIRIKGRMEYTDEQYQPRATVRLGGGLPSELRPNATGTQDNTWQYTILNPGDPGYTGDGFAQQRITVDADGDGRADLNPGATYTCGRDNSFLVYPKSALDADIGTGTTFGSTALGLSDFGPGFCIPNSFGSADGRTVSQSVDPFTGEDYPGTDQQTFRASLIASIDVGSGTVTSSTGWTDFKGFDAYDQDYQNTLDPTLWIATQQARTTTDTKQFSQELRFASDWEGPVQATVGGLYWKEERDLHDQNWIIFCSPVSKVGGKYGVPTAGPAQQAICDGMNGTLNNANDYALQLPVSAQTNAANGLPAVDDPYVAGTYWEADTTHLSAYLSLSWEFAEKWKLTLENRYVKEDFYILKPNKSSCTTSAFSPGPAPPLEEEVIVNPLFDDIVCESEAALNPSILYAPTPGQGWAYVSGSESSHFNTPKATVEWFPTDDSMVYVYAAHAEKPGGINQLIAGGIPAPSIEADRFDPEKLNSYELGTKNSFELAGFMQVNAAVFFQDYTDKQVSTQVIVDGQAQPRVLNAGGAEVYGIEIDGVWQPDAIDGLTLSAGYTWLHAEYTEFDLTSGSLTRAAVSNQCTPVDGGGGSLTCLFDLSGNKLERTPENAVVLQANLTRPMPNQGIEWYIEANGSWQDDRFTDEDNSTTFDAYWLVDARLGLIGDNWEATAYIDNLLDDDTIRTGGSGPDFGEQVTYTGFTAGFGTSHYFGVLPTPRTFGLRLAYNF